MTETQYTEKDLQNMADQLLREADQQQHEIEEEVIKGNKGRLDERPSPPSLLPSSSRTMSG